MKYHLPLLAITLTLIFQTSADVPFGHIVRVDPSENFNLVNGRLGNALPDITEAAFVGSIELELPSGSFRSPAYAHFSESSTPEWSLYLDPATVDPSSTAFLYRLFSDSSKVASIYYPQVGNTRFGVLNATTLQQDFGLEFTHGLAGSEALPVFSPFTTKDFAFAMDYGPEVNVLITDPTGIVLVDKAYSCEAFADELNSSAQSQLASLIINPVSGQVTHLYVQTLDNGSSNGTYTLIRIDSAGDVIWTTSFDLVSSSFNGPNRAFFSAPDGSFLYIFPEFVFNPVTASFTFKTLLQKINPDGSIGWSHEITGTPIGAPTYADGVSTVWLSSLVVPSGLPGPSALDSSIIALDLDTGTLINEITLPTATAAYRATENHLYLFTKDSSFPESINLFRANHDLTSIESFERTDVIGDFSPFAISDTSFIASQFDDETQSMLWTSLDENFEASDSMCPSFSPATVTPGDPDLAYGTLTVSPNLVSSTCEDAGTVLTEITLPVKTLNLDIRPCELGAFGRSNLPVTPTLTSEGDLKVSIPTEEGKTYQLLSAPTPGGDYIVIDSLTGTGANLDFNDVSTEDSKNFFIVRDFPTPPSAGQ